MRIVNPPRAIGLRGGIDAEQEGSHLAPVGVFGRGIEQAQVKLGVTPIVVGQMIRHRGRVVRRERVFAHRAPSSGGRYFFFLPLAWARSEPATVFSDLLDELLFSSFDAVEAGFYPVVIVMSS